MPTRGPTESQRSRIYSISLDGSSPVGLVNIMLAVGRQNRVK